MEIVVTRDDMKQVEGVGSYGLPLYVVRDKIGMIKDNKKCVVLCKYRDA
jgi:hypothetical protein